MPEEIVDILVASYQDLAGARPGFDALCKLIKESKVTTGYGVILVAKDPDGSITLAGTGDHLGRKALAWGAGVGLVIGLFSPPMLASILAGSAADGLTGNIAGRNAGSSATNLGDKLIPGTAAVIAVIDGSGRAAAAQALANALTHCAIPIGKSALAELEAPMAEAIAKFRPHQPLLPIPVARPKWGPHLASQRQAGR